MDFLKTLQRLKQEWQKSPALGPGKQTAKTCFSLEKKKENWPNYQCLPLLIVSFRRNKLLSAPPDFYF
jgi:hypothetical protein